MSKIDLIARDNFNVEATVNFPEDQSDTPLSKNMSRAQLHRWLDQLLDTEPELTSFIMTVVRRPL